MSDREQLLQILRPYGQEHVLNYWDELDEPVRSSLAEQVRSIDFARIKQLYESAGSHTDADASDRASRAVPPAELVEDALSHSTDELRRAKQRGIELLAAGNVGAIVVAGGQGTRLGFDHPKGMFPIGPVKGTMLFRILAQQLLARAREAGKPIPYYVMTSDATADETIACFEAEDFFGLPREDVFFFRQGNMPAVDDSTGKILLAEKGRIATSPDGHGGLLNGLQTSGALADMRERGIEFLHYHQVDNPTAIVCDPVFVGLHALRKSDVSTKVVAKVEPAEKMGVVCDVDGSTQIIEYSDMPDDIASKTDDAGELLLRWGNTAIHVFSRAFFERLCSDDSSLAFHVAHKKVPHLNDAGEPVSPDSPNAYKFEKFIFDSLPKAETALVVETDRTKEFNPVKNAEGSDSPATARAALVELYRNWLEAAGAEVADDAVIEISPLFAVDSEQLTTKIKPGQTFSGEVFLGP
ncbi:UTP--glucose-1-phosphate uridylyltransferase [Stratiformator vulcanicus]|uniref:Putative uridylyltransferase n=1 Tax=Stratiformator vulcanicus TaxID=2527980 RepID=A0A517QZ83_9PLAN|nr:UDPGP type 1 family protein [Stratiformator vulcanicus]QDT36956.1 putative uridylyltransferase [Stratiformator vulcanicus]